MTELRSWSFKWIAGLLMAGALVPTAVLADLPEALTHGGEDGVPAPDGQTLARILRELAPDAEATWTGTLSIRVPGTSTARLPVSSRVRFTDTGWSVRYETKGNVHYPAECILVIHSTNGPNRYLRAVANHPGEDPGEPKPLALDKIDVPFAASDFLVSDLGLEFLHWPRQVRLRGELRRDRTCHVLESSRTNAPSLGYTRVVSWVDKESGGVIQAEAYDARGRQVKVFSLGSFRKINGSWQLQDMEMIDLLRGSRSKIQFDLEDSETAKPAN